MNKESRIKDWARMFRELTDPTEQARARRKVKIEARKKEKISDSGL